jgi:hypothetical protein
MMKSNNVDHDASDFENRFDSENETSTNESEGMNPEEERDEVKEVKKMSAGATNRIRMWRLVLTLCLVATAVAITTTTYKLLVEEQERNFEVAVSIEEDSRTCVPFTSCLPC